MSTKYGGISREESYKKKTEKEKAAGLIKFHLTESELKAQPSKNKAYDNSKFYTVLNSFVEQPTVEALVWLVSHMDYGDLKSTIEQTKLVKTLCYDIATQPSDSCSDSR